MQNLVLYWSCLWCTTSPVLVLPLVPRSCPGIPWPPATGLTRGTHPFPHLWLQAWPGVPIPFPTLGSRPDQGYPSLSPPLATGLTRGTHPFPHPRLQAWPGVHHPQLQTWPPVLILVPTLSYRPDQRYPSLSPPSTTGLIRCTHPCPHPQLQAWPGVHHPQLQVWPGVHHPQLKAWPLVPIPFTTLSYRPDQEYPTLSYRTDQEYPTLSYRPDQEHPTLSYRPDQEYPTLSYRPDQEYTTLSYRPDKGYPSLPPGRQTNKLKTLPSLLLCTLVFLCWLWCVHFHSSNLEATWHFEISVYLDSRLNFLYWFVDCLFLLLMSPFFWTPNNEHNILL